MAKIGKYCPGCGGDQFGKDRRNGADTGEKFCVGCKGTYSPDELLEDTAPRSCKAPQCGEFIPSKKTHMMTLKKDYVPNLKKGVIACPFCDALHQAENVVISESGPGSGAYSGTFGALTK